MKTINYSGRMGKAVLAFSLMFGFGIMMSLTAQAQGRNDGEWQRREQDRRIWQERHRDQKRARREARRNNRRDDRYERSTVYGNNGGYNNDGTYNNGGYNNGGYNNQNQNELNQGYQAGINTGASDAQRRQSYSPQRSSHYKNARSQAFREGFVRGYDAGFRQYAGGNNGGYNNGGSNRTGNTGVGIGDILGVILGRP